ncbi:hypothetical protein A2Z33_04670 [Candidatus Gottesmanbacteria bacterium RBG_16_52_11]|uniref:Membrane protein 6-pyruvoyl-tetrahydropterin synthase-related domain-containing protein n=1 Tax=Candidatus Gottesmanbacteria bacterium RBG_16_52_11 TaxID=1798374 RepID=A0A1F5YUJ4_9BACT|nr:MAG: hypothetical protein A2Z33_04670 [Candidatus Gottesmanbacteria bacterium RBG_16_52_11]
MLGYVFVIPRLTMKQRLLTVLGIGLPAAAVAAVQLVPTAELASLSDRIGQSWDYATFGSFNPVWFAKLWLPALVGDPRTGTAWIQLGSVYGYVGGLTAVLALVGWPSDRTGKFLASAALISAVLAMGKFTPVFAAVYFAFPGMSFFRVPSHFLLITGFSLSLLAGRTLELRSIRLRALPVVIILTLTAAGAVLFIWPSQAESLIRTAARMLGERGAAKLEFLGRSGIRSVLTDVSANALASSAIIVLAILFIKRLDRRIAVTAVSLLLFAELYVYAGRSLISAPATRVTGIRGSSEGTSAAGLPDSENKGRLFVDPRVFPNPAAGVFGIPDALAEFAWQTEIMRPNTSVLNGYHTVGGYAALPLSSYSAFLRNSGLDGGTKPIRSSALTLAGVSRAIVPAGTEIEGFTAVKTTGSYRVLVSRNPSGRFWLFRSGEIGSAGITGILTGSGFAAATVSTGSAALLVYTDTYAPGWRVKVDGHDQPVLRFGPFKAVSVAGGSHTVRFTYDPISFRAGLIITGAGIAFTAGILIRPLLSFLSRGKRIRRKPDKVIRDRRR